jgi:polyisoprenoid-binding protein YceI
MRINNQLKVVIIIATLFLSQNIFGQDSYKLDKIESSLSITGTSTLHDWHMNANEYSCLVQVKSQNESSFILSEIEFSCESRSIKSDNSIMDGKAHDAINADKWKIISFKSNGINSISINENKIEGIMKGILQISGTEQEVNLPFTGELAKDGKIKLKGGVKIKLTDYKVEPPKALMGTIKTGNDIEVHYEFKFSK